MCEHTFASGRGDDPPRRPRRLLRVGRAARRSAPARPAGDRRRRGRARRQLRGQGARRADRDGRRPGPAAVPATRSSCRPACRVHRGQPGGVRGVRGHHAARRGAVDRRGVPRRPRHGADRRHAGARSPPGCARACASEVGLPITVGIARTKFLAKVASGVAKPDGLLVVPPGRELAFLHPLPVERLWGVGRVTAERLHARGVADGRRGRPARRGGLVAMLGRGVRPPAARARPQPRPAAGAARPAPRLDRRPARAGPRSHRPAEASTPRWSALVDRVTRRMRAAGRVGRTVVLRLRFDDFTRATRSHTLARATAATPPMLATARVLLAGAGR